MIDIRLLHQFQELPRIGRQALDIPPLPLGIDGVERQARLARSAEAGDHRQRIARNVDRHVLEIMLARTAYAYVGQHAEYLC